MTKYSEALSYFNSLSNSDNDLERETGLDILNTSESIKEQSGDFIAAKFILDVYENFTEEVRNSIVEKRSNV